GPEPAEFRATYRPVGEIGEACKGSLEYFLVERYALYTVLRNATALTGEIHHQPWPPQRRAARTALNTAPPAPHRPVPAPPAPPHCSARQDTLIWPPKLA